MLTKHATIKKVIYRTIEVSQLKYSIIYNWNKNQKRY